MPTSTSTSTTNVVYLFTCSFFFSFVDVVGSAIGFVIFTVLLFSWALTFAIGGERLFGPLWGQLVMYNVADRLGLTGWNWFSRINWSNNSKHTSCNILPETLLQCTHNIDCYKKFTEPRETHCNFLHSPQAILSVKLQVIQWWNAGCVHSAVGSLKILICVFSWTTLKLDWYLAKTIC